MALLREARLSLCFYLGWHLRRIDAAIGFRDFPQEENGKAGLLADWRSDQNVEFNVAMALDAISGILESRVLSVPVSRRLDRLKRVPFEARSLAEQLRYRLIVLDLARSQERARWLQAGWLLQEFESWDSGSGRARYERSQIPDLKAFTSEVIWNAARTLTPDSPAETAGDLQRIQIQFGSDWFSIVAGRADGSRITASSAPIYDDIDNNMTSAWSPLRVFLSHSSKDKPVVRRIYETLREQITFDAFLDERELRVGDQLDPVLEKAIAGSDFLLEILSASSYASDWFWKEFEFANRHHVPILPLRVDDADVPALLRGILHGDLRQDLDLGLERTMLSMTNNPALPFLRFSEQSGLETSLEIQQVKGVPEKVVDLTVSLRAESACTVKSMILTTLGQWDIQQPGSHTTTYRISEPGGLAAEIRPASGSKAVVPVSLSVESGRSGTLRCRLFTRHDRGNGLGRYLYLLGAELVLDGFRSINLGVVLADLHGLYVAGRTQATQFSNEISEAIEVAEEVLRITPSSCVMDPLVSQNLREITEAHN